MTCQYPSASPSVPRLSIRLTPEAAVARNLRGREIRGAIDLEAEAEDEATDAEVRVAAASMVERGSMYGFGGSGGQNDDRKAESGYESGRRSSRKD